MPSKDASCSFCRIGFLLPLCLIFLFAADATYACPDHNTRVVHRSRAINSPMGSTVITYRAPASYRRCGDNLYDTRGANYVAMRGSGPRYVAVRNGSGQYKMSRTRYIAVRNDDFDHAPRYVAVRRYPAYADTDVRYVAVRNYAPRTRYVTVRDIDIDDAPRYVAMRRVPIYDTGTSYVAVRNVDDDFGISRTQYIAVRNVNTGCRRAVALRSCLDKVETTSAKHVVLRTDSVDPAATNYATVRNLSDDDDDYIALPSETAVRTSYVEHTPADYTDGSGVNYVTKSYIGDPCMRQVALRTCPEAVSNRTINVRVSDDEDIDDLAFLDGRGTTYVAADEVGDACLSRMDVRSTPAVATTRAVSFVPIEDVDNDALQSGSGTTYIAADDAVPKIRYVALDDDRVFDDVDPTSVSGNEAEDTCLRPVALRACEADIGPATTSYVPVEDVQDIDAETVSYVPVSDIEGMDAAYVSYVPVDDMEFETVQYVPVDNMEIENISYVPVDDMDVGTVSYVPVNDVDYVDATDIAADECPTNLSSVDSEPVYVADTSTVFADEGNSDLAAVVGDTRQIAGEFGYSDGFEDGLDAALERDVYHPESSGDYKKATNGYEDTFGDKDVYKGTYRDSYLQGYSAGFNSATRSA